MKSKRSSAAHAIGFCGLIAGLVQGAPVGTAFTYQGQLKQSGVPVNGTASMVFSLWDAAANGNRIGVDIMHNNVEIVNGLFTVALDFGTSALDGNARWLEIAVSGQTLSPRQPITAAPYATTALTTIGVDGHSLDAADRDPLDAVFVDEVGNVGIGTTTPSHQFQVVSAVGDIFQASGPTGPITYGAWELVNPAATWSGRFHHASVVHGSRVWVMGGQDQDFNILNDVWSSADGLVWVQATAAAPWVGRSRHNAVVHNGEVCVIGGRASGSVLLSDVWCSEDGVNWAQRTAGAAWARRDSHASVVHNGRVWVLGGFAFPAGVARNDVWSSPDGTDWTEATPAAAWAPRGGHTAVVHDGRIWVMGGRLEGNVLKNDVWSSEDGVNWVQETAAAPWAVRWDHASVVRNGRIWVLGGDHLTVGAGRANDVWYSADGINWTRQTDAAEWDVRVGHSAVAYGGGLWVLGGVGGSQGDAFSDVWSLVGTAPASAVLKLTAEGRVGIGTTTPGQKLSVGGTIESLSGGFKFPDGTVQTTVGAEAVHNHYGESWTGSAATGLYVETLAGDVGTATIHARQGADTPLSPVAGVAVWGESDQSYGVFGNTAAPDDHAAGVIGYAGRALGDNNISYGVQGQSTSTSGEGLYGFASSATGATRGVHGKVQSPDGYAGYFEGRGYFSSSVGIGTATPDGLLHLSGGPNWTDNGWKKSLTLDAAGAIELGKGSATKFGLGVTGSTLYFFHTATDGGAGSGPANYFMTANSSGNVAIGTTDAQGFKLAVNGTAAKTGGGSWSTLSDRRLKKNVEPLAGALSRLLSLRGVTFEFTEEGLGTGLAQPGSHIGLIAQEVERVFPEWVSETPNGHKFVTEQGTTALLVEALRELRTEKNAQLTKLQAEKDREIASLRERLARLERQVAERLEREEP